MVERLKLGAVGLGNIWNGCHAPVWLEHPEIEIVGVCDIVEERAQKFAAAHHIPHAFTDYRELLKLDLDFVDICTPNLFHSKIAIAALQSGKHVMTEKPDAINPVEARKMADAAKKSKKTLMAMRNNRFTPQLHFLKKYIQEGHMGEIYTGRAGWIRRRGIPGRGGWFTTKALSGGGPLIDLGVHVTDLALWLMDNPHPTTLSGAIYNKFAKHSGPADSVHAAFGEAKANGVFDVEDLATGFVRFDNGATLQLEFSWASNIEEETIFLELRGTKSGFSLRNGKLTLFTEIAGTLCDITPKLPNPHRQQHAAALDHFVDVLRGRKEPIITPEHGVDMIKILAALYASAAKKTEVKL